jgi:hypothetical protein
MEFEDKIAILADLWLNYKDMDGLKDFLEYNDIGLPLAYTIYAGLSEVTDDGIPYVEETYNLLAESLGLDLDEDFSTLAEMLAQSEEEEE